MIGLAAQDGERAVELLEEDQPGQAVRQRQPRQRQLLVGAGEQHKVLYRGTDRETYRA